MVLLSKMAAESILNSSPKICFGADLLSMTLIRLRNTSKTAGESVDTIDTIYRIDTINGKDRIDRINKGKKNKKK